MASKLYGLLLKLGGAPNTPHVLEGLPGYYYPEVPHPVGEGCDISLEAARAAAKEHSDALELVVIPAGSIEEARALHGEAKAAGRNELREASRDGRARDDVSRTEDEHDAVKEA
jgi:hypothetical protein